MTTTGGFNAEDIDSLLQMMEIDYEAWIRRMAPAIMRERPTPMLTRKLLTRFEQNDPEITRHFARVTFTADHRADLSRSTVPALILQCSDDMIAPRRSANTCITTWPTASLRPLPTSAIVTHERAVGQCRHHSQLPGAIPQAA
jgi:pimeloyl-ACP methyl ester carboxylesterase